MNKKTICVLLLIINLLGYDNLSYSQTNEVKVIPPTPEAAALGKFGSIKMGSYTGAATFSIPLYTVKGKNLEVPITLDYSSNGIMVEDIAPWTGFGWTINGGGIINRTVLDRKDELRNFQALPNINTTTLTQADCQKIENQAYDMQYDEFTFNFMGNSGKFMIVNQKARIIEATDDFKIEIICSTGPSSPSTTIMEMKITDKNGIKYCFGKNYSNYDNPQETAIIDGQNTPITSWHLTRIIHWNGEIINFEYQKQEQNQYLRNFGEKSMMAATNEATCSNCPIPSNNAPTYQGHYERYRPIVYHLSAIRATNSGYYDYITIDRSTGKITGRDKIIDFDVRNFSGTREFLKELLFKSTSNILENKYVFEYDHMSTDIARDTKSKDWWGYYNGQTNTSFILGNHNAYPDYAVYGMLTQIFYPTGGRTTIEYEGNSIQNNSPNSPPIYYGGVRVKKIASTSLSQPHDDIILTYDYNNSGEFAMPNQYSISYSLQMCDNSNAAYLQSSATNCDKQIRSSVGYYNNYGTNEGAIFYSMVTEKAPTYETVHYYNGAGMKIVGGGVLSAKTTNVNPLHFYGSAHEYMTEYYEIISSTVKRLIKRETSEFVKKLNLNGEELYSYIRERKSYGSLLSSAVPQNGPYYTMLQLEIIAKQFNISKYRTLFFWRQLKSKKVENFFYNASNIQTSLTENTDYYYTNQLINGEFQTPIHHQVTREVKTNATSTNNSTSRDVIKYSYPDDLGTSPYGGALLPYQTNAISTLSRNVMHRIATPIQTEILKQNVNINTSNNTVSVIDSTRISTQRITYKDFGSNRILPEFIKNRKGVISPNNELENKVVYVKYTSTQKVLEAKKEGGSSICYLYDHEKKNAIAMIENATFSQIAATLGISETDLENISQAGNPPLPAIEALRTSLPTAMITTYTYNSRDLLTSIVDPKGNRTTYQYDMFNRLVKVRDNEGNVISENEYHYKQ